MKVIDSLQKDITQQIPVIHATGGNRERLYIFVLKYVLIKVNLSVPNPSKQE